MQFITCEWKTSLLEPAFSATSYSSIVKLPVAYRLYTSNRVRAYDLMLLHALVQLRDNVKVSGH